MVLRAGHLCTGRCKDLVKREGFLLLYEHMYQVTVCILQACSQHTDCTSHPDCTRATSHVRPCTIACNYEMHGVPVTEHLHAQSEIGNSEAANAAECHCVNAAAVLLQPW